MEGQDHDLLVRIDERVTQIHARLDAYDEQNDCLASRIGALENNQSKALGIISVLTAIITLSGREIISLIFKR
jgi:prefoldin subunit 5